MKDYPSEEELERIEKWEFSSKESVEEFLNFVKNLWNWEDGFVLYEEEGKRKLYLSTGGWRGNEDLVNAIMENFVFRVVCWERSERGGHYVFDLSNILGDRYWRDSLLDEDGNEEGGVGRRAEEKDLLIDV